MDPSTHTHAAAGATPAERPNPPVRESYAHIPGWGSDLDPANRPAYPRERKPNRLEGVHWTQPEQQAETVEVLHSSERPSLTPVFGTTVPPAGVSGGVRRFAFRFSENDLRHWLLLLAADRIQMVEGLVEDFGQGRVPNVFAEVGGPSQLRHNPRGAAKKALVLTAVLGVAYLALRPSRASVRGRAEAKRVAASARRAIGRSR